jgi:hypothetical protein
MTSTARPGPDSPVARLISPAALAGRKGNPTVIEPGPRPEHDDPLQRRVHNATGAYLGERVCVVAYPVLYVGELDSVRWDDRNGVPVSLFLIKLEVTSHHCPHEWAGHPPLRVMVPWDAIDRFELPPAL